jgi:hypothetical protein
MRIVANLIRASSSPRVCHIRSRHADDCLILLTTRSIKVFACDTDTGSSREERFRFGGMFAHAPCWRAGSRIQPASFPRSASNIGLWSNALRRTRTETIVVCLTGREGVRRDRRRQPAGSAASGALAVNKKPVVDLLFRTLQASQIFNDRPDIFRRHRRLVCVDHLGNFRCPNLLRQRRLVQHHAS